MAHHEKGISTFDYQRFDFQSFDFDPFDFSRRVGAHRGASGHFPENTLLAFEEARKSGVQWIEADLNLLADDVFIIFHDENQGRTVAGSLPVHQAKWADFETCDAGIWKGSQFSGQRVMCLADFLEWAITHEVSINLEVKCYSQRQQQSAALLSAELARHMDQLESKKKAVSADRLVISSFNSDFLYELHKYDPDLPKALICNELPPNWCDLAADLSLTAIHLNQKTIDSPKIIEAVHAQNLLLRLWTVNDWDRLQTFINYGVDQILTDYPDLFSQIYNNTVRANQG